MYNAAQTFFLDKELVKGVAKTFLTSVDLYFKSKPTEGKASSGINKPGVRVTLGHFYTLTTTVTEVDPSNPGTFARVEYDQIQTSVDASIPTKFTFKTPIEVFTDQHKCILISFDGNDNGYELWKNSSNEVDVITGQLTKVSSGKVDGNYVEVNGSVYGGKDVKINYGVDLKFRVNVAKFTQSSNTFVLCNDAYEFISLTAGSVSSRDFIGGEYVYQAQANLAGSVTVSSGSSNVSGSGTDFLTDFANGDLLVVGNTSVSTPRKVNVVVNTTFMNVTSSFNYSYASANYHSYETGTISVSTSSNTITGTGTSFSSVAVGSQVMITDGTEGNTEMRSVISVSLPLNQLVLDVRPSFTNSTAAWFISPTGKVERNNKSRDKLYLSNSSANSTMYFTPGRIVKGVDGLANAVISTIDNVPVNFMSPDSSVTPSGPLIRPSDTSVKIYYNVANSSYSKSDSNKRLTYSGIYSKVLGNSEAGGGTTPLNNYPAMVASRSNEVQNPSNLFANSKSFNISLEFATENPFVSPVLRGNYGLRLEQVALSNVSVNEAYANGSADNRYISKTIVLDRDQVGEDIIVNLKAFKPSGTDLQVYVKLLSEEDGQSINDKNWSKLTLDIPTGSKVNSIASNPNDLLDLKYVVPRYNPGTKVTTGTFTTALATNVITSSFSTVNTSILVGDLVRVYSPTKSNTYFIDVVTASNTTTFTVSDTISNSSVVGAGLSVDVITEKSTAFLNNQNFNVVRYFSSSSAKYDGYKFFAVKIVMLSDNSFTVPVVRELRAIATSA